MAYRHHRTVNGINAVRGDNQEAEKSEGPKIGVRTTATIHARSTGVSGATTSRIAQSRSRRRDPPEWSPAPTEHSDKAADTDFGSDSFDDGLTDVLANYDETSMGDAEAASHALEMEIDEAQRQRSSGDHDDSGDTSTLHPNHNADDERGCFHLSWKQRVGQAGKGQGARDATLD